MNQLKPVVEMPDFESVVIPADQTDYDLAMSVGQQMLAPATLSDHFINGRVTRYIPITQPNGMPYYKTVIDGTPKLFYMFGLPKEEGSRDYYDDPNYMIAVECRLQEDIPGARYSIHAEKIHRGPEANFVMAVSYLCCSDNGRNPKRVLLRSVGDATLAKGYSARGMKPGIMAMWQSITQVNVLGGNGLNAIRHLALDVTGKCNHQSADHALSVKRSTWQPPRATL